MSRLRMNWDWDDPYNPKVRIILFTEFLTFENIGGKQMCRFEVNVCLGEDVTPRSRRWKKYTTTGKSRDSILDPVFSTVRKELKAEGVPDWVVQHRKGS